MATTLNISIALKQLITSEQAYQYRIVPFKNENNTLFLKTDYPNITELSQELHVILNRAVELEVISEEEINTQLAYNYRKSTTNQQNIDTNKGFLEQLIASAKDFGSSDIHLEPYEKSTRVRYRLDGKLKEQYSIPLKEYPQLVNQIKIKAGLDITQTRLAQDGRITFKKDMDEFDIRVSSMPTLHGEKIVLRLLNKNTQNVQLDDLGFTIEELNIYREAIKKPQGIVLISGPTGSGKTTTLYGTLKELNKETTNVLTIEDPIEYTLEGVNQVQLRDDIGFDFPAALRTFLRQDPDVIMVGEIRDNETAAMAIKAALTGHLVLSTIHTNSAWATISRLIDMKVPPFLLASTLTLSIAQRLVRKLCPNCKKQQAAVPEDFPLSFEIPKSLTHIYKATGCNICYHTGYEGRKAIYEILPITKKLEQSIRDNELRIDDYITSQKIVTLQDNAIRLINEGVTSVEEVYGILAN